MPLGIIVPPTVMGAPLPFTIALNLASVAWAVVASTGGWIEKGEVEVVEEEEEEKKLLSAVDTPTEWRLRGGERGATRVGGGRDCKEPRREASPEGR